MRWLRRIWRKSLTEKKLDSELQFHVEQRIAENISSGMSPEEANRQAKIEFGGIELFKEECRDQLPETYIHSFLYDLRYAWRSLRKDVRFFFLTVFALALGIGSSTVIFSVVYNGMLHPFPYRAAERLVAIGFNADHDAGRRQVMFKLEDIDAFRQSNHTLEDIVAYSDWYAIYTNSSSAENLHGARVSGNVTEFFGVPPLLGRGIAPEDEKSGAPPVLALSYRAWTRYFQSDPNVIGRTVLLDGNGFTVVGVMPKRYTVDGADFWAPIAPASRASGNSHKFSNEPAYFFATGRLKPGVPRATANADLQIIAQQNAAAYPDRYPKGFGMAVESLNDAIVSDFKSILILLTAAVAMLMLISCSNVANLLLARATAREKEMALRASVGASRPRLVRQLLTESFLLAVISCFVGCLLSYAGLKAIVPQLPGRIPGEAEISLNPTVLLFAVSVSMAAVLLCGLSPALHAVGGDYRAKLSGTGPGSQGMYRHGNMRSGLVIAEIALAVVLLVCSGLMMRSFYALTHVNLGFDPTKVMSGWIHFPKGRYTKAGEKNAYLDRVLRNVEAIPGVEAVTVAISSPPISGGNGILVAISGKQLPEPSEHSLIIFDMCSESMFKVLDLQLLQGRTLSRVDVDSARKVIVVNRTFARKYFNEGENVLGQTVSFPQFDEIPEAPRQAKFEIVGVVSDIANRVNPFQNNGIGDPPMPQAYLPYTIVGFGDRSLLVRTSGDPNSFVKTVAQQVARVDHDVAFAEASGLNSALSQALYVAPQFALLTITSFAVIGLLLVIIGVFGLMAYTVSLQKHEIGIRMALGAKPANILNMILKKGIRLIGSGIVVGVLIAYCSAWILRNQFWHFSPADPLTYCAVGCLLVVVGLGSCWLPARRATRVDPMTALRYE